MLTRLGSALAWCVFFAAVVLPTLGLLLRCVLEQQAPQGGFAFSVRQLLLLGKTAAMALAAVLAGLGFSLPGAWLIGSAGLLGRRPAFATLIGAALLLPPTVYAFGWQRIVPPGAPGWLMCILVWALWACPVPAFFIGLGWARRGQAAYQSALLDAGPAAAFRGAAWPLLAPYFAGAMLAMFVLFFGDYAVPHAWALTVFATELLALAADSRHPIDTLWPAMPCILVIAAGLFGLFQVYRRTEFAADDGAGLLIPAAPPRAALMLALAVAALAILAPIGALLVLLRSLSPMREALETYGPELLGSLAVAAAAGVICATTGFAMAGSRLWSPVLAWCLAAGILPGALIGEALIAAYLSLGPIYSSPVMVVLGYIARFLWIGVLVGVAAHRAIDEDCVAQARTDGADSARIALSIRGPAAWPMLLFGACLIAALSLAEIPTAAMVQVPSLGLVSQILIEKFHKAEDGMLISLSMWLVLAALLALAAGYYVLRRR